MLESPLAWLLTASKNVKVSFLQGFFESAAKIDAEKGRVAVKVPPLHAPVVLKLLLEVGAYPMASSVEPSEFAVSVDDAARIPLFSPVTGSRKFDRVLSLARLEHGPRE